jgi:hypothetical protein
MFLLLGRDLGCYPGGDAGLAAFFAEKLIVIVIPSERGLSQLKM